MYLALAISYCDSHRLEKWREYGAPNSPQHLLSDFVTFALPEKKFIRVFREDLWRKLDF